MFESIPESVRQRMQQLEEVDRLDRIDGTAHDLRLRQVSRETGRFLAIMAAVSPEGSWLEIGTSAGYSALWISLAGRERNRKLVSYEIMPEKIKMARETIRIASIEDWVELRVGDGLAGLVAADDLAFCFLDADKEGGLAYFEQVIPRLVLGGLFLVDNAISHQARLKPVLDKAFTDPYLDCSIVPVGKGVLISRRNQKAIDPVKDD
ncbi:MAG: O-methyltransferase [Anaerolineales bacterium]|nr:MAG: O-methyltransferase [Anaerolineales bacterium]